MYVMNFFYYGFKYFTKYHNYPSTSLKEKEEEVGNRNKKRLCNTTKKVELMQKPHSAYACHFLRFIFSLQPQQISKIHIYNQIKKKEKKK